MRVLEETGAPKVNIIGHSMGGLDSRYLSIDKLCVPEHLALAYAWTCRHFITHLGGHEVTAALITLGTPHRGSAYSDWVITKTEAIGLEKLFEAKVSDAAIASP